MTDCFQSWNSPDNTQDHQAPAVILLFSNAPSGALVHAIVRRLMSLDDRIADLIHSYGPHIMNHTETDAYRNKMVDELCKEVRRETRRWVMRQFTSAAMAVDAEIDIREILEREAYK